MDNNRQSKTLLSMKRASEKSRLRHKSMSMDDVFPLTTNKDRKSTLFKKIQRAYLRQSRLSRVLIGISSCLLCVYLLTTIVDQVSSSSSSVDQGRGIKQGGDFLNGGGGNNDASVNDPFQHDRIPPLSPPPEPQRQQPPSPPPSSTDAPKYSRMPRHVCNPNITASIPLKSSILSNGTHDYDPTLIVISIDGFRADYLNRGLTPEILALGQRGVRAEFVQPSFPTLTFPNHYTLVTGQFPDRHGIVANMFYDPAKNEYFNYRIPEQSWDAKWWGGEPIWQTAIRQNQRSGVIMWPGGEVKGVIQPTHNVPYTSKTPVMDKMMMVVDWMDLPRDERPTIMSVYVSEVDTAGHYYGPESKRVNAAISQVDVAIGTLMAELRTRHLAEVINVMIVSDHGMSYVSNPKAIFYDDYIDPSKLLIEESLSPHLGIWTKDEKDLEEMYNTLTQVQLEDNLPFKVYRRHEIPERYHYSTNLRVAPVVVMVEPGYIMTRRDMGVVMVGVHGWDHEMENMRAVMLAAGPSFKAIQKEPQPPTAGRDDTGLGVVEEVDLTNGPLAPATIAATPVGSPLVIPPIENVELYEVMARTVGLKIEDGQTDGLLHGWLVRSCDDE